MNIDYLNSLVEHIKLNDEAIAITPRELFSAFGFMRRSKNNCRTVDEYLDKNALIVEPHYNSVWVDATKYVELTTELSEYIHDSLNVSRRTKASQKQNPCVKYILINTCNDTVVHKADLRNSESITNL